MPLNLDSCIAGVFTPGNIGASSGLPPVAPTVPSLSGPAPTLVEIASASETLDAFFGELLHEATSISDSYTATGGAYLLLVSEMAAAVDTVYLAQTFDVVVGEISGDTGDDVSVREPAIVDATLAEAAAATDTLDADSAAAERDEMVAGPRLVMLSSDGTPRDAMVDAIMVNE